MSEVSLQDTDRTIDCEDMDGASGKLKFSQGQHEKLNYIFNKKIADRRHDVLVSHQSAIAERLTQRLLSSIGQQDTRFSCKYLVSLTSSPACLEYLVRLDDLSTPAEGGGRGCEVVECESEGETPGFGKVFVRDKGWGEFVNNSGYLRRDKVQEKFVELLATAAASNFPSTSLEVDESVLCGSPGKVLDAYTLQELLKLKPEEQVFSGAAVNSERYPEPRDFRLAIVDEPGGVRLRIGFLSPSLAGNDIEVHLLLGIGFEQWPRTSSFPSRVPLEHPECLLYYQAAQTGMYLVARGVTCASWQMVVPAAEVLLLGHHGLSSCASTVLAILEAIVAEIKTFCQDSTSKYIWQLLNPSLLKNLFWHYLEQEPHTPITLIQHWSLKSISKHTLALLKHLQTSLAQQNQPSYIFPNHNLLQNPHLYEEDFHQVISTINTYLHQLHDASQRDVKDVEDFRKVMRFEEVDQGVVDKWGEVVGGLVPPAATRSRRLGFAVSKGRQEVAHTQYTRRQLEYIGMLLKNMLVVKKMTMTSELDSDQSLYPVQENPIEDVIFLLVTIMEQVWKSRPASKNINKSKSRANFDAATTKLVESVRKNKDITKMDFEDDLILVQTVLRWLYKGLDQSKHSLAPILRPYLQRLFISSHEICWHLEGMKRDDIKEELNAIAIFCRLVNSKEMSPANALIESVNKGWNWAKNILLMVEKYSSLSLAFTPQKGKTCRHILALPTHNKNSTILRNKMLQECLNNTLSRQNNSLFRKENKTVSNSMNSELRDGSPLTALVQQKHRLGNHRCFGDLIQSLISLNKISCLQEISSLLPSPDRQEMLLNIQRLSKDSKKYLTIRKKVPKSTELRQTYTRVEEDTGTKIECEKIKPKVKGDTLIENCRSVRVLDDCRVVFGENLKIRALSQFNGTN